MPVPASLYRLREIEMLHLTRNTRRAVLLGVAALVIAGCGTRPDPFTPGAPVNSNPNTVFATLMQRPDIDQATRQYEQMGADIRHGLGAQIPELATWTATGETSNAACGNNYPGIGPDGQVRDLPDYVVPGKLPDDKYEQALSIIGATVQNYGFSPTPQRLHDAPGSHDTAFHNAHDDSTIRFGTDKNTLLGISVGCHLTVAAKNRGHLSSPSTS